MPPHALLSQTVQASVLSASSNAIAQLISAQRNNQPYGVNIIPVLRFLLFTALSTPPNCVWQQYLESQFPGLKDPGGPVTTMALEKLDGEPFKDKVQEDTRVVSKRNIMKKLVLDQTLGSAVNTVLFITVMRILSGAGLREAIDAAKLGSLPLYFDGLKLWPLVSLINFAFIPVEKRVVFATAVGVLWNIYLSLYYVH